MIFPAPPRLNFIHVAKCGGTSVKLTIENLYDKSEIYPYHFTWQLYELGPLDPRPYRLVMGHLGLVPWRSRGGVPENTFTWLREPRQRMVSSFTFQKQRRRIPADLVFEDWLAQRIEERGYLPSLIGWLLCGAMFRVGTSTLNFPEPFRERLRRQDQLLADEAMEVLDRCPMVGLTERFADSMNLLHFLLDALPAFTWPVANRTLDPFQGAAQAYPEALEEYTRLDQQVYRHGCALFQARYREMKSVLGMSAGPASEEPEEEISRIRDKLRARFFRRHESVPLKEDIHYTFERRMIGSGWHEREHLESGEPEYGVWRWIDPETGADIYFPLSGETALTIYLGVCHVAKPGFFGQLEVAINGVPIALAQAEDRHARLYSQCVLKGDIDQSVLRKVKGLSRIAFDCRPYAVPADENPESLDFRKLNVALNWIAIRPKDHTGLIGDRQP